MTSELIGLQHDSTGYLFDAKDNCIGKTYDKTHAKIIAEAFERDRNKPDVPELKRYKEYWDAGCIESPEGEYVLYAQAAAMIAEEKQAAIDARNLLQYEKDQQWRERAEVAEAEIKKLQDILAHSKLFSQKRNENNF